MSKINRVLLIGLGSIGQRHLRVAKKFLPREEYFALRAKKRDLIINDDLTVKKGNVEKFYGIKTVSSLRKALSLKPDLVFVTNPSSLHIEYALPFLKQGAHLLIEKPLGDNLRKAMEFARVAKKKRQLIFVGYQFQFHPLFREIKSLLQAKKLGKLCAINISVANYVPIQHRYEPYETTYVARRDLGGGVVLSQSHEINSIVQLFGLPNSVYASGGKLSRLKLSVEDTADALLQYKNFSVNLHMDLLQYEPKRSYSFIGVKGTAVLDFINNTLRIEYTNGKLIRKSLKKFTRNSLFMTEHKNLLQSIGQNQFHNDTLLESIKILKIADAIKRSIKLHKIINVN